MGGVGPFILRRLLWSIPVLLAVCLVTFVVLRAAPGGPFDREKELPAAVEANLMARYDLDKPIHVQFALYMGRVITGDLDWSMKYMDRSVNDILADSFPVSALLGLLALAMALILGLLMGAATAVRKGKAVDHLSMLVATMGFAIPSFVLGTLFILVFSVGLDWLPPALWEGPSYWLLPALTLAIGPATYVARLTRSGLLAVLSQDYIRTARAKGLSANSVLWRHAMRNAIGPVITVMGPLFAWLITGSFVVEFIFSIPGMGRYFVTAVIDRDYTVVMGATLVYAVIVVVANLLVDLLYGVVDPRLRTGQA